VIYISVPEGQKDSANFWVQQNVDPSAEVTFILNKQDSIGNKFCVISMPSNGSIYNNAMSEKFGTIENLDGLSDIQDEETKLQS